MAEDAGVDYDLRDIFAAATTDSTASNGSYGDYFYASPNCVAYHGGSFDNSPAAGLFFLSLSNGAGYTGGIVGGRLAKV